MKYNLMTKPLLILTFAVFLTGSTFFMLQKVQRDVGDTGIRSTQLNLQV